MVLNTPLHKIPKSFQNVIQIEALQFRLGSKFIQERNQRFWFFRYWMTSYNRIVCRCQVWEYYNDNDWKEFCVGSLDFMKAMLFSQLIVQLLFINNLKPLKI